MQTWSFVSIAIGIQSWQTVLCSATRPISPQQIGEGEKDSFYHGVERGGVFGNDCIVLQN